MADSPDKRIPTATEIYNAVCKIRELKPGLGLKKVITILRDTNGWSIHGSRLRKLVAHGDGMNDEKNEASAVVAPTLPGILSNNRIRGLILGPLLTVTDEIDTQRWSKNLPDLKLLHVSRDIRKVAWNFMLENNTWVQARFVWDAARLVQPLPSAIYRAMSPNEHGQPALIQGTILPNLFTPEMTRDFQSSVAVTISIGHSQGQEQEVDGVKNKDQSVFFAFHPQKFDFFVHDLAGTVKQWGSMTVEVNHTHIYKFPSTIPIVVDGIIRSLDQMREVNRVTSISLLKDPIDPLIDFKKIAETMMSPREVRSGIRAKMLESYNRGTTSIEKGDYLGAFKAFLNGHEAYDAFRQGHGPKPKWGSIQNNAIELLKVDIDSMAAEALNRMVSTQRSVGPDGGAGPRLMAREIKARDMPLAVLCATYSLNHQSITDDRRFYSHYRRAIAHSNLGDFIAELTTVIPKSQHAAILRDTVQGWNNAGFCYRQAAHDAFYATHLAGAGAGAPAVPQELVDTMHALRRRMCDKVGYTADEHFAQMHRYGLARLQLPVLGTWEGDPMIFMNWGPERMMLLALFRQQEGTDGLNTADLREALAQRGLSWTYDKDGEIYLEGKKDAHMKPTWVVPDNTSHGIRAAGLSGGGFEMARR